METNVGENPGQGVSDGAHGAQLARQRVEEALRESEERFGAMVRQVAVGIATASLEGRFEEANPKMTEILGYSAQELIGMTVLEVTHPGDVPTTRDNIRKLLAGEVSHYTCEKRYIRKDGHTLWSRTTVTLIRSADGQPKRFIGVLEDITSNIHAKQALLESQMRLNLAMQAGGMGAWEWVIGEGRVVWSETLEAIHGLKPGTFAGTLEAFQSDMHPEDRPRVLSRIQHCLLTHEEYRVEYRIIKPDGSLAWVEACGKLILNDKGEPQRMVGICMDVTSRKQTHEAHYRLASLVESSDDAIVSKTLNGTISTWNLGAQRMFGYSPQEAVGKPVSILIPAGLSDEAPLILAKLMQGIPIEQFETKRRRKDGTILDVSLTVSPIRDETGRIVAASKIIRDITQRKRAQEALRESEERFRVAADSAPVMLGLSGPDKLLWYVNRAWLDFVGGPIEAQLGDGWMRGVHPEDSARCHETYRQSFDTRRPFAIEYRLKSDGGPHRWVAARGVPRFGSEGTFEGYIIGCTDIHDRKMASQERELLLEAERCARAEAERLNIMKDQFLATLSHELRTPLSAILGWSQLLASGKLGAEALSKGVDVISRNARAQSQLIEDLLDMSRIDTGKVRIEPRIIDLSDVVSAATAAVEPTAQAKRIQLQTHIDPETGAVLGDPNRLQQVVWNLLTNAVKFTPQGGSVEVQVSKQGEYVSICVADTGAGITEDFLPYVFDRFRQGDASTTREHGGLGLGLSIVKHLVELHGGTIQATSAGRGKGSQFTCMIPAAGQRTGQDPGAGGDKSDVMLKRKALTGVKVLVIEDEQDARELVRRVLVECKAYVITAGSAGEGFELLKDHRPSVIVCDIGMPGEDGYQFIERVRGHEDRSLRGIPAIALTAFARPQDRDRAIASGFQAHLAKPVEARDLVLAIAQFK